MLQDQNVGNEQHDSGVVGSQHGLHSLVLYILGVQQATKENNHWHQQNGYHFHHLEYSGMTQ
jgi:hypothetical protein